MPWLIQGDSRLYVAAVTFDGPSYVERGLQIAAAVDAAGIPTGSPVRNLGCWGTLSWGPLLFDLLTWERFFAERPDVDHD